eukprot:5862216-Ditylum_brightwellii.AAC.1
MQMIELEKYLQRKKEKNRRNCCNVKKHKKKVKKSKKVNEKGNLICAVNDTVDSKPAAVKDSTACGDNNTEEGDKVGDDSTDENVTEFCYITLEAVMSLNFVRCTEIGRKTTSPPLPYKAVVKKELMQQCQMAK